MFFMFVTFYMRQGLQRREALPEGNETAESPALRQF
jgi:hypothetical protein